MTVFFNDGDEMAKVLGINDANVPYLEFLLSSTLTTRGNQLTIDGGDERIKELFSHLARLASTRQEPFAENELYMEWCSLKDGQGDPVHQYDLVVASRSVWPKSRRQKEYVAALFEKQVVFATGPAGTGKTFLAIAYALSQVLSGRSQKLVLTRPVVEAGESLGFLPGDLSQKLNPYLRPLYDAMEYFIPPAQIRRMEEAGQIEISPLAYMRGRSLNRSIVLLDEAQNTTRGQMKMFLTRLGEDSKAVITGDLTQIDLPKRTQSGLVHALGILHDIEGLAVVQFRSADIIRSRLVKAIIDCYQDEEERDWND